MGGRAVRTEKRLPVDSLEPKEFEDLCAALLEAEGHEVRHWGDAGAEHGVDLLTRPPDGGVWAVQCKRTQVGPQAAAGEVQKVLDKPPEPGVSAYLLISSSAISRTTEEKLEAVVEGRFEILCWGASELHRRLLRHPELIRNFFGDPWVPRRLVVTAGWRDREWVKAFRDDLAATLPAAGFTVAVAVPEERDALVEVPDADGVLFALTAEALADRRLLDAWESAALPAVRDGRRRGLALALDGAPWPPCFEVCERLELAAAEEDYRRGLGRAATWLSGEERVAPGSVTAPGKLPRRLPEEARRRLVEWLVPVMEDDLHRQFLAVALGLGHMEALEPFATPSARASAAIVLATADDAPVEGAFRLIGVIDDKLGAKEGTARREALQAIGEKLRAARRPAAGDGDDDGLLAAWLRRIRRDHRRLVPFFQAEHELELLDRVYVELSMSPEERLGGLSERGLAAGRRGAGGSYRLRDLLSLEPERHPEVTGRWVVRGDPGSGKTTLLRHLAATLAAEAAPRWVPVFQSLPVLLREGKPLLDRVEELMTVAGRRGLKAVLERAGQTGGLLVLLDGLDEVGARRPEAEAMIRDLAERWPKSRIVVTTRLIGYRRFAADFREVELLPLDSTSRETFLARWFGRREKREDRPRAARAMAELAAPGLDHLAGNPLYLTLMAILIEQEKSPRREPSALYDQVFELLLEAKHKDGQVTPIERPRLVRRVLRRLAYEMTVDNLDAEPRADLEERLYHPDFDDLYRALQKVGRWKKSFQAFLDDLAEKVGILADHDGEGADWRFWHRTFREALAAEALAEKLAAKGGEAAFLAEARRIAREDLSRWAEPYALVAGQVEDPDALVRALVEANRDLGLRALATAPNLGDATLREILELAEGPEEWEERAKVYARIPDLIGEAERALALVDQLRQRTRNGNDLYFLDLAVSAVAERWPKEARLADGLRRRFYDHVGAPPEELFQWVETRDGRVELWREIPAGEGWVGAADGEEEYGDERPRHRVTITAPFRMAAVAVTNAQYGAFDPGHRWEEWGGVSEEDLKRHPVVNVTWYAATSFCRWLAMHLPGARLPVEEEWEYACRAGTETRYWSGGNESDLAEVGWYAKNSEFRTYTVGAKPANLWGLYDMHGNVWEWQCTAFADGEAFENAYKDRGAEVTLDPPLASGAASRGGVRVIRGGSFADVADRARSACRFGFDPRDRDQILGFRVVLPAPEPVLENRS